MTPLAPLPPPTTAASARGGGGVVTSSQENEEGEKEEEGVVYVVKPFVGLSTPDVFRALDLGSCSQVNTTTTTPSIFAWAAFARMTNPPIFECQIAALEPS